MIDESVFQFVDTNILVYAYDLSAGNKHEVARALLNQLWDKKVGCISIQVLQEFYNTTTRKIPKPLESHAAVQIIQDLKQWRIHGPNIDDVLAAITLQVSKRVSFWDALIIHSAQRLGCAFLWSEDLNHGQIYDNVQIRNPFIA
jgi:predicted nucleic acid-binding protein